MNELEPWHVFFGSTIVEALVIAILAAIIVFKNKQIRDREIKMNRAIRLCKEAHARLEGSGLTDEELEKELLDAGLFDVGIDTAVVNRSSGDSKKGDS